MSHKQGYHVDCTHSNGTQILFMLLYWLDQSVSGLQNESRPDMFDSILYAAEIFQNTKMKKEMWLKNIYSTHHNVVRIVLWHVYKCKNKRNSGHNQTSLDLFHLCFWKSKVISVHRLLFFLFFVHAFLSHGFISHSNKAAFNQHLYYSDGNINNHVTRAQPSSHTAVVFFLNSKK